MDTKKKFLSIFLTLMILFPTFSAYAQEEANTQLNAAADNAYKHEVYLSYGNPSFLYVSLAMLEAIFTLGTKIDTTTGVFTAGYDYQLTKHIQVGGFCSTECFYTKADDARIFTTLQGKITTSYGWERVKFYHALSLGGALFAGDDTQGAFMLNVTVAGLKAYVLENTGLFAELNLGSGGIITGGASFRF